MELKFDGSYDPFTKFAGGIIRSPIGTLWMAYAGKVSSEDPVGAELSSLLNGIQLCILIELGLKQVIVEGDCLIQLQPPCFSIIGNIK